MPTTSPQKVYDALVAAGFSHQTAVTMTAIAGAESGYNTTAVKNTAAGTAVGLWGILTRPQDTGTGSPRDIARLTSGDLAQAQAAYQLTQGGRDLAAFSSYRSGAYRSELPTAEAAARSAEEASLDELQALLAERGILADPVSQYFLDLTEPGGLERLETDLKTIGAKVGDSLNPFNWVGPLVFKGLAGLAGLGLAVAGLWLLARRRSR